MKVGFVGLGKLGLPVALAISSKSHKVCGYDIDTCVANYLKNKSIPYMESRIDEFFDTGGIDIMSSIEEVVLSSDLLFVAVQTPHEPLYEGITRIPECRANFDYSYLQGAFAEIASSALRHRKLLVVSIISTVLPGTIAELILPITNKYISLCYNPFFIAMGTTIDDFLNPEFVLLGSDNAYSADSMRCFYATLHSRPIYSTNIENAELIKVAYNTAISAKITFANTLMEICSKMPGLNVDAVIDGLLLAGNRLFSPAYLRGGMGDGGGCHPRDNIALSWLAQKLDLSFDFFNALMLQRESQTEWMAVTIKRILQRHSELNTVYLLGAAFKANTNITTGSPGLLLSSILLEHGVQHLTFDPHVDDSAIVFERGLYFISTKHDHFLSFEFPAGSVVIDPFRYIPECSGVKIVRIGEYSGDLCD